MGVNSLPKTVTRQRRGCDLNPDPSAPESSTLTTRLPSHSVIAIENLSKTLCCKSNLLVIVALLPSEVVGIGRAYRFVAIGAIPSEATHST